MADERTEKQKVQEITDKLEEGLKELFESEKYKTYLSTMSKFHNYSFNNTLLIAMQKPEATLVAGYKAWQKNFERHVNKGEKAIRILAPAPYKIKEERDKLDPVTGEMMFDENGMPQREQVEVTIPAFRAVSVFDVSQTDGKPIPELEAQELLSTVERYEDFVQALMNVAPVPIGFEDIPGDSKGYFHTEEKRIAVQENMSESQTLKTMVHEVAHSMLHNKEINRDDLMEAPAEYSVAARFFRNHPFYPFDNISFAASSSLPQRPYMVRFIIFNLLFVPSTKPFDKGLATAFSTADKSFSSPEAKRESSLRSLFLYFSINRYKQGMLFR